MKPSDVCAKNIMKFEGCAKKRPDGRYDAYPDPGSGGDPWTIGWGSTGPDIKPGTIWTQAQADTRFAADLAKFATKVDTLLGGTATTQAQFDGMVSLAYNIGDAAFAKSTLLKRHKLGDYGGAAAQFAAWNRAGGKVMTGLTKRRAAEMKIYQGNGS